MDPHAMDFSSCLLTGNPKKRKLTTSSTERPAKVAKRKAEKEYSTNPGTIAARNYYTNQSQYQHEIFKAKGADSKAILRERNRVKGLDQYVNACPAKKQEMMDSAIEALRELRLAKGKHLDNLMASDGEGYEDLPESEEWLKEQEAPEFSQADLLMLKKENQESAMSAQISAMKEENKARTFEAWRKGWRAEAASLFRKLRQANSGTRFFLYQLEQSLLREIRCLIRCAHKKHAVKKGYKSRWQLRIPKSRGVLQQKLVLREHGELREISTTRSQPAFSKFGMHSMDSLTKSEMRELDRQILALGKERLEQADAIFRSPTGFFTPYELAVWRNLASWYFQDDPDEKNIVDLPAPKSWYTGDGTIPFWEITDAPAQISDALLSIGRWTREKTKDKVIGLEADEPELEEG